MLCGLLVASLIMQPLAVMAADPVTPATKATPHTLHIASIMLEDLSISAGKYLAKVDTKILNSMDAAQSAVAVKEIDDQIAATKKSPADVEALRREARSTAVSEAKRSKEDLINKLMGASIETLDRYGAALQGNPEYRDVASQYAAAYTRTEKAKILTTVVQQDMDQVLSASLKRLNWLTADGLRLDLQRLKNRVFEGKGDGDGKKLKRILMIAGAAVAFIGLATWGIASVKYGNALKQQRNEDETTYQGRKTDLDNKFAALKAQLKGQRDSLATTQQAELNALVSQLSAQYDALTIKLHSDELNFLSTNGYVWMQCNSYSQPSSIICNNYNYQVFVGSSTCTVMCYKNVMQNKETLHAAPVCSSPYIPADCYSQAKYDAEYNAAYNTGYTQQYPNGTHDGQIAGNTKGSADGKADGNANGDSDGYNDGYNTGYKDEYTTAYNSGYNSRYNDGYEAGYTSGYNDGYNSGYDAGYSDGYNSYVPPSSGLVSNSMMNRNSSSVKAYDQSILQPKFKTGYSEGFRDAKLVLSLQQTDKA
jgi:hypothetical protein